MALRNSRKFSGKMNSQQKKAYQNALRMIAGATPSMASRQNALRKIQKPKNTAVARKTW